MDIIDALTMPPYDGGDEDERGDGGGLEPYNCPYCEDPIMLWARPQRTEDGLVVVGTCQCGALELTFTERDFATRLNELIGEVKEDPEDAETSFD